MSTTSLSHYLGGNDMKTTTQELNQYITRLFQLSNNETWECEALEEADRKYTSYSLCRPYSTCASYT